MASIAKTIFIFCKVTLLSFLFIRGLSKHWKQEKKNYKIIGLLLTYQILLILITIAEIFFELIPLIFIILVAISASQIFQVHLFTESCAPFLQPAVK